MGVGCRVSMALGASAHPDCAGVAELADAPDLGSGGHPRAGSSPVIRISHFSFYRPLSSIGVRGHFCL